MHTWARTRGRVERVQVIGCRGNSTAAAIDLLTSSLRLGSPKFGKCVHIEGALADGYMENCAAKKGGQGAAGGDGLCQIEAFWIRQRRCVGISHGVAAEGASASSNHQDLAEWERHRINAVYGAPPSGDLVVRRPGEREDAAFEAWLGQEAGGEKLKPGALLDIIADGQHLQKIHGVFVQVDS